VYKTEFYTYIYKRYTCKSYNNNIYIYIYVCTLNVFFPRSSFYIIRSHTALIRSDGCNDDKYMCASIFFSSIARVAAHDIAKFEFIIRVQRSGALGRLRAKRIVKKKKFYFSKMRMARARVFYYYHPRNYVFEHHRSRRTVRTDEGGTGRHARRRQTNDGNNNDDDNNSGHLSSRVQRDFTRIATIGNGRARAHQKRSAHATCSPLPDTSH